MTTPLGSSGAVGRASRTGEEGWALVETLVSAVLLIVIALAITSSLDTASDASAENKQRSIAAALAEQDQERMRGMDPTALSNYHPPARPVTTPDGGIYTVTSRADWIRDSSGDVESCTQNTTQSDYLRITSTVTSTSVGTDTKPVVSRGIVTPAVGTFGAGLGTFTVQVVDRNDAKVSNMNVSTSGTRVLSDLTNSLGCAIFGYVPIGPYTGTASATGWVDRDGNPTASASATVTQGTVAMVQVVYDQAGSLAVTLDADAPQPGGTRLNISQPAFPTPRTLTPAIGAGNDALTINNLFPFATSRYNVYAGTCTDADPSRYTGETVPSTLVTPGNPATPLSVHLPRITVNVKKGGLAQAATVRVASTVSGCGADVGTASTDPTTGQAVIPMPYGHYTICAVNSAGNKATVGTVFTPVNNTASAGVTAPQVNLGTTGGLTCP
jgi:type II secretory pathway pseudopilin PulG